MIENILAGIVLTAQSFNPTIFNETWLDKNDVLSADSLEGIRACSPDVANFQTKDVRVIIMPAQMQISFGIHEVSVDPNNLLKIPKRIIELLPHTPYQALGLNFDFFVTPPADQDFLTYNQALLGTGDYKLLKEFSAEGARFGRYFSKNHGDARLKLDVKPVQVGQDKKDLICFQFNFHHDVANLDLTERPNRLIHFIDTWDSLRDYAASLVDMGTKL